MGGGEGDFISSAPGETSSPAEPMSKLDLGELAGYTSPQMGVSLSDVKGVSRELQDVFQGMERAVRHG